MGHLVFFLFLLFPVGPWEKALAAESEEERTARLAEGAKKEGRLLWYAALTVEEGDRLLRKFQEKYPFINAGIYRAGGQVLLTRIMAEVQSKKPLFDVVHTAVAGIQTLKKKGIFVPYDSPQRKFLSEGFKDSEGYWSAIYLNLNAMGYNTRLVSPREAPRSYEDLLAPRWKGKMGMDTKAFEWFGHMLKIMGEKKGLEFMRRLSEQNIQFRTGKTLITQLVAAGEMSIGITLYNQRVEEMKAEGAPIEWIAPEPVIPDINPLSISAQAPHPNAARLLVDFILSREGQQVIAGFRRIPTRVDVDPLVPKLKQGLKILPYDFSVAEDYEKYGIMYRDILMKGK